jgi:hypothetical protein
MGDCVAKKTCDLPRRLNRVHNTATVLGEGLWRNTVNMDIRIATDLIATKVTEATVNIKAREKKLPRRQKGTTPLARGRSICRELMPFRGARNAEPCCRG